MKKILHKLFGLGVLSLLGLSSILGLVNAQVTTPQGFGGGIEGGGLVGITADGGLKQDKLITSIKTFINRVLGILALITLIILLRGGFQMVTAAGDEGKYKEGFKVLKQAAFGLGFIGLSRLMVSLIFYVIGLVAA